MQWGSQGFGVTVVTVWEGSQWKGCYQSGSVMMTSARVSGHAEHETRDLQSDPE